VYVFILLTLEKLLLWCVQE